jgi:hypothetical protein
MAIGVYFRFDGATVEQYDEVSRRLNNGAPLESLSQWPTPGCLAHSAWQEEGSLAVFDVWESAEAFEAFGPTLMPIAAEAGLPAAAPHIVELHSFIAS